MTIIDVGLEVAMIEAGITAEDLTVGRPKEEDVAMSFEDFMIMTLLADAREAG